MIVTVTPNPSIDRTILADRLAFEDRGYILDRMETAGGRGINASAVIHNFGAPTIAVAPCGGPGRDRFVQGIERLGFPCHLVPIAEPIRFNLIITDKQGLTVKLNEPGPAMTPEEIEQLERAVRERLPGASWLLLSGSLPQGMKAEFYCRLIKHAESIGVPALVDSEGDILHDLLSLGCPAVVTPNQHEAGHLLNKAFITRQHFRSAAQRILAMGAKAVILSLAARGAVAVEPGRPVIEVVPPRVTAISPIGAGDALNAAFAWARTQGATFAEAVRWGVAAGTASAGQPGLSFASLDHTREIYEHVEIREAPLAT